MRQKLPNVSGEVYCTTIYRESDAPTYRQQSRTGLEIVSRQDLFVLRSVTTLPFPVTGEFVQTLADEFQRTLEAEVKVGSDHVLLLRGTNLSL